jgi:hypothetical protein
MKKTHTIFENDRVHLPFTQCAFWFYILYEFTAPDFLFALWAIFYGTRFVVKIRQILKSTYIDLDDADDVGKIKAFIKQCEARVAIWEQKQRDDAKAAE